MYKGSRELDSISPQQLDNYLSRGWFRMNQSIFTTPFLQEGLDFRDAIWLRHHLHEFEYPKRFHKLQQKNLFNVEIRDLLITPEHELLYQQYRESRPIEAPPSLENIVYGEGYNNIYQTKIINLYINDQLVGSGIFDLGEKAAAGIVNFYNPLYAKYSPGKFLFLLAVQYCQLEGLEYFYPGYFVPGNTHFDYKLDISKVSLSYFDVSFDSWVPITSFREMELPTRLLRVNLMNLIGPLEEVEIPSCFIHNANYFFLKNSTWDTPFATYILPTGDSPWQFAITYNSNNNHYYIFDCTDMDCAAEIFEEDGRLVCFQFLNLKHPIAECHSVNDTVEKLQKQISSYKEK